MRKNTALIVSSGLFLLLLISTDLSAASVEDYGFKTITEKFQGFIFGWPMKLISVMGGGYGLAKSILSSSMGPCITYGGLAITGGVMPTFVDKIFGVTSMLLP